MYLPTHYTEEHTQPVTVSLFYDQFKQYRVHRWGNTCLHENVLIQAIDTLTNNLNKHSELINVTDLWLTSQSTPLLLAVKQGCTTVAELLLKNKACPNKKDYKGFTPLHYACMLRLNRLILSLIESGANPWSKNSYGKIPFNYYLAKISHQDLMYPYGFVANTYQEEYLKTIYDNNFNYQGTICADYSALRWYIHLINFNQHTYSQANYKQCRIAPLWKKSEYQKEIKQFVTNREKHYSQHIKKVLIQSMSKILNNEYQQRKSSFFKGFILYKTLIKKQNFTKETLMGETMQQDEAIQSGRCKILYQCSNTKKY